MNTFEAQGLSGDFEFESDMQEFDGAEFEGGDFGEAEYGEAEFDGGEFEGEWDGEVRDHRRRPTPRAAVRSSSYRRPAVSRSGWRPSRWSSRQRAFAAPRSAWGTRRYASRPFGTQQRYRVARPSYSSRWSGSGQYPRRYWQSGQQQSYSGSTPQWGYWDRWGRWRRRYPYGRYGYGGTFAQQPYDEPAYAEPPYEEPPPPPPPVIVAPPPPPSPQSPMPEPPPVDPVGTTPPPPAQNQAKSEEFFIEPETFEFEPEVDEYESGWGELQGEFEQYEGGVDELETGRGAGQCPPYQRGEVEKSRTAPGHLPSDVIQHSRGLLIADFGVDWRTPKSSLRSDATLRNWVDTMVRVVRANPSTQIRISGYSDCVGQENNNAFLRRGRAQRVRQLLQQIAGPQWSVLAPKIIFTGAAPAGDYVSANGTVDGRAQNRGVLIEHTRTIDFAPDEGTVIQGRDTIERICRRGVELIQSLDRFGTRITRHQQQRIRCFISRLCQPGFDDRYLTGQGVLDYANRVYSQPYYANAKQWLLPDFVLRSGQQRSDQDIWQTLIRIDDDIIQGRAKINYFYHTHGAATPIRVQQLRDWVAQQESNNQSIYVCYGTRAP